MASEDSELEEDKQYTNVAYAANGTLNVSTNTHTNYVFCPFCGHRLTHP